MLQSIIAISLFHKLDLEDLWIEFDTGVNVVWLPIHEYVENSRESICQVLSAWFVIPYPLSLGVTRGWLGIYSNYTLLQQMHSKCKLLFH